MRSFVGAITLFVVGATGAPAPPVAAQGEQLALECRAPFTPDSDVAALLQRFGAANVVDGDVYVGEGMYEPGTVLYADDPARRAEILWKDATAKRHPASVRIRGTRSRWTAAEGISIGTRLKAVERVNRRPFRLTGFGWDYGGSTISWSSGRLDTSTVGCWLWLRFLVDGKLPARRAEAQVMGERIFSSGHPAMQVLDPIVWQMGLNFAD